MIRLIGKGERVVAAGKRQDQQARRAKRFTRSCVILFGVVPVIAVAWSVGCSDSTDGGGGNFVDPGGTFGAEISLTVVGRGRVTSSIPGLDCPSDCFAKFIFPSATADGAAGGITLKAEGTPGASFKGWSFEAETIGSAGRGPANCNPIKRPASLPSVSTSALEISLPFGEVEGTPPAGQEAACARSRKVPTVYKITASFDTGIVDAGADANGGEILYAGAAGATGGEIGVAGGRLFWRYTSTSGYHGISYIDSPTSAAPQPGVAVVSPTTTMSAFEIDPAGVAYQTSTIVSFIPASGVAPASITMSPSVGLSCYGLAVDTSANVYCRTSSTIVRWLSPLYSTMERLYSAVDFGYDLHVDSVGSTIYYATSAGTIYSLPLFGADGGVASPTLVTSAPSGAAGLEGSGSYLWWVQSGYLYSCTKAGCLTPTNTGTTAFASGIAYTRIAADTSSLNFWAASSSTIYRSYYAGGSGTTVFQSGRSGIGGVAADSSYVYWTEGDGSVRRASKGN